MSWGERRIGPARRCCTVALVLVPTGCATDTPVSFSNFRVEDIGTSRAVVRFDTSEATTCEAEYGLSAVSLPFRATDPSMAEGELTRTHEVSLEDLSPQTQYFVRARATDANGRTSLSQLHDFTTRAASEPSTRINVALISAGARVSAVSSNFGNGGNDSTWGANKAFDGMMASEWATAGDGDDAFVEISLPATRQLLAIAFRSRAMNDGSSIITRFRLIAGGETRGPFSTPDPAQLYTFELSPALRTGRVRIEAEETSGGNTGAREIQLLAAGP